MFDLVSPGYRTLANCDVHSLVYGLDQALLTYKIIIFVLFIHDVLLSIPEHRRPILQSIPAFIQCNIEMYSDSNYATLCHDYFLAHVFQYSYIKHLINEANIIWGTESVINKLRVLNIKKRTSTTHTPSFQAAFYSHLKRKMQICLRQSNVFC